MRARVLSATVVIAVVMAALTGVLVVRDRAGAASVAKACRLFESQHVRRLAAVSGRGAAVMVIGDSWSVGHKLRRLSGSWPSRLPGRVTVDGFSGSGFSAKASECGAYSFATRAAQDLRLGRISPGDRVVVEGGLNDFDRSRTEVGLGFRRLVARLTVTVPAADLLIVGPAPAPARLAGARRVDHWLAALSREAGVAYLSAIDLRLPYLRDRLHLTAAGHQQFGDWVASRL